MQRVSAAYRNEQNEYLRNESYVYVYLGIVNREAQANAKINGTFTSYSAPDTVTKTNKFEAYYAIPEENFIKTDESMYFLPRDHTLFGLWQGAVTQELSGSVTFTFLPYTRLDIKGLTIDFGEYYPTKFRITNGQPTYNYLYENDTSGQWVCEDVFKNTSQITITPIEMIGGKQRLRILSMMFGVGLMFDNNTLVSTSWKQECDHISSKLPSKQFTFAVSNINKKFSADDPHSFVSFLQEKQDVEFHYGRKLEDGSIYTIKGGNLKLKTWASTDKQAKFTAVGFMDYLSGTYKKGRYYPNGISLWQLAVDVCIDAGIEDYVIDNYLKTLITHNPLPVDKHKNLLQLIANSARSIMFETRSGGLEIRGSFEPDLTSVTTNSKTAYSVLNNIVDEQKMCQDYVTSEKDYVYADSRQFFLPRNQIGYVECGYVSGEVSDANGLFNTNPTLTFQWEATWTFFNLKVLFGYIKPEEFIVRTYNYGTLVDTFTQDEIEFEELVNYAFYDINKLTIEFTKAKPYNRIHVNKVRFGTLTDYSIDYRDMSASPTAATAEYIRNVNVNYYEYAYGNERKQLGTAKAIVGENEVIFTKPCHNQTIKYKDGGSGTLRLLDSGAYFIKFTSTREAEVNIEGVEFMVTTQTVTNELHQTGTDKTSSNVLIDNLTLATAQAGWLGKHFANDINYTISYRGEPAIDADDQIYTENIYVEKNLVRVVNTQIDSSQGMSMKCKITGRRTHYIEPALVDVAIVDESEVI